MDASALEWTLTGLDEDKEIEDFAARVPGFLESRAVPQATTTILFLLSDEPTTDHILASTSTISSSLAHQGTHIFRKKCGRAVCGCV
jgi:aconitase A